MSSKAPIVLVFGSEFKWSRILQGHLKIIQEVAPYVEVVDFEQRLPGTVGVADNAYEVLESNYYDGRIVINLGNHQYGGSATLARLTHALSRCAFVVGIIDDYTAPLTTQIRKGVKGKDNVLITTVRDIQKDRGHLTSMQWAKRFLYANWNAASYQPIPIAQPTERGLLYYGMYREGRAQDFGIYLGTNLFPVHISASRNAHKKFDWVAPLANPLPRFTNMPRDLQQFEMALYLEDKKSHTSYTSPANRFYECLSAGIYQVFDIDCVETFNVAGISVTDYVVQVPDDIKYHMQSYMGPSFNVQRIWQGIDFRGQLLDQVRTAFAQIGI